MTGAVFLQGDASRVLQTLPVASVNCIVTSPPYWGWLRRYTGLDETQLGLERTSDEYVAKLVDIFEAMRRVLRDDGTCWVNMGDKTGSKTGNTETKKNPNVAKGNLPYGHLGNDGLAGVPWRFALAMQAAGWRLRSSNIWAKNAPMPESVDGWYFSRHRITYGGERALRDCPGCPRCTPNDGLVLHKGQGRTTRAHEYLFQFVKSKMYYWDKQAVSVRNYEVLSDVQDNEAPLGFWDEQGGTTEPDNVLQRMPEDLSATSGPPRSASAVLENRKGESHSGALPCDREVQPNEAAVLSPLVENREGQGHAKAYQPLREGEGTPASLLDKPKGGCKKAGNAEAVQELTAGSRFSGPEQQQKRTNAQQYGEQFDAQRMGNHQTGSQISLRLLQEEDIPNQGSHYSSEQGRQPHGGERDSSLPFMQFTQGQPTGSSFVSGANPRSVLHFASAPLNIGLCRCCGRYWHRAPAICSCGARDWIRHYAAFPTSLPEWCIKASTSEAGCCSECGAPWVRVVENTPMLIRRSGWGIGAGVRIASSGTMEQAAERRTLGFRRTCQHRDAEAIPATVLDPFCGSGSTLIAALNLGRRCIGIDASAEYITLARHRVADEAAHGNSQPEPDLQGVQGSFGL